MAICACLSSPGILSWAQNADPSIQLKGFVIDEFGKPVRESCNKDKKVRVYKGPQQLMVFDWQSLANLIKEYDITSFFDPQRTM